MDAYRNNIERAEGYERVRSELVRSSRVVSCAAMSFDPKAAWLRQARAHVAQGEKIQAIKVVREATGWDLSEAKRFVESPSLYETPAAGAAESAQADEAHAWLTSAYDALLAGDGARAIRLVQDHAGVDAAAARDFVESGKLADAEGRWLSEARAHVANGDTIQAIKVVREGTGLGLSEAKGFVESPSLQDPGYLAVRRRHLLP